MTKAMILAAGLGTRLRPVTDYMPKALVVVEGKPLLQHALEHLKQHGIREVIINVHHFPEQIRSFVEKEQSFGMDITFSGEEDELLDTGGGLKRASWFFPGEEPFVVRNADIISSMDLGKMLEEHVGGSGFGSESTLATLAVRDRESSRYLLFDNEMLLSGWENRVSGERVICRPQNSYIRMAFSGIQVVSPSIFPLMSESGSFSLIPLYLRLAKSHPIKAFIDLSPLWLDGGKPQGCF